MTHHPNQAPHRGCYDWPGIILQHFAAYCSTLRRIAAQHFAAYCSTLRRIAAQHWPAIEGQRLPRKSWVGMKLTALVLASPLLAIGFLWMAYYLVQGLGVLALIFAAVLA